MGTDTSWKTIQKFGDCFTLSQNRHGFWLYDHELEMNLAMKAKTSQDAFVEALEYYQQCCINLKTELSVYKTRVDNFINLFKEDDETV